MSPPLDLYAELFGEYLPELRSAHSAAMKWWGEIIARETEPRGDPAAAEYAVRLRWPLGPATYPRVIAVYRKYYLLIDEINSRLMGDDQDVPRADPLDEAAWRSNDEPDIIMQHPHAVLYERLDEVDKALARFLDSLVFIPIGADHDGRPA
jgi:hypothetical protein